MSGVCGLWQRDNSHGNSLNSLTAGLALVPEERLAIEHTDGTGVGVSARFDSQQVHRQPGFLIACDAELYNEDELKRQANSPRPVAKGSETAGLLIALYERLGCDFVSKLRGAFAFVLWDEREQRLIAATDGFGIKRLVYYEDKNRFLVASRINALLRSGLIDAEVNVRAVATILNFTSDLAPATIFEGITRLAPGTILSCSRGNVRLTKYWDMMYDAGRGQSEGRLSRQLEEVVADSVAAHCKNDIFGEIGAFLSGGTDSSTVVGLMSRLERGEAKAFSIGFKEQPFNELGYAEIAARKFKAKHYTYLVSAEDCVEALPNIVRYFDEPFGNSSAIPTYFCARLAAQNGVKALLAGDGGDELFGGNERYATDKLFAVYQDVPRALRRALIEPAVGALPFNIGPVRRARGYLRRAKMAPIERYSSYQFLRTHDPEEIFEADFLRALGGYTVLDIPTRHYDQAPAKDHLDRLLYVDMKITLADNDLPKVTCMSELAGLQTRFPFLDRAVAEFSGRVPASLKVKGFEKRYLFKRAFRELLPIEIIRKKKHGFGIPVAPWMKSHPRMREISRDTLLSKRTFERGYFRRQFIEQLFRKHETEDSTFYGDTLWTFLMVELWHRQVVDQPVKVNA